MKQSEQKPVQNRTEDFESLALLAMEELQKERALRIAAEEQLAAQQNKVLFADAVSASGQSILVGEMANILKQSGIEIGQNRLFARLRESGYLYRQPCGDNRPTQKSLELGVMELKEQVVVNAHGKPRVTRTVKVTPKGQLYFMELLTRQKDVINGEAVTKKTAKIQRDSERRRMKRLEANAQAEAQNA